jgi:hypothetical protein
MRSARPTAVSLRPGGRPSWKTSALTGPQPRTAALPYARLQFIRLHAAQDRLERDRHEAIGSWNGCSASENVPAHRRYDGELVGFSTGLLSGPFFEWLTRIYLLAGQDFDTESGTGDNVFVDRLVSDRQTRLAGIAFSPTTTPGTIRVFPFRSYVAPGIEDPTSPSSRSTGDNRTRCQYAASSTRSSSCRAVIARQDHVRGLRHVRRVAFFGLVPAGFAEPASAQVSPSIASPRRRLDSQVHCSGITLSLARTAAW